MVASLSLSLALFREIISFLAGELTQIAATKLMTSLKRANSHESDFDISFQIINEHNELTSLTEVKDPNKGGRLYGGWRLGEEEGEEGEVGRITAEMERQNRLPFKTTIEMCKLSYVIVS